MTGLPLGRIPEEYLITPDDRFDTSRYPECDLYDVRSIAAAAGYLDWRYFRDQVITAPGSHFHAHGICGHNGCVLTYATHTMSAAHGGNVHRAATLATQTGEPITDVTGGSRR